MHDQMNHDLLVGTAQCRL